MSFSDAIPLGMWNGGVHRVATVDREPDVRLYNWSIKVMNEGRYFVGNTENDGGRVSTNIVELDMDAKRGTTESGRVYELVGEGTTPNRDAAYVWDYYKRINRLTELYNAEAAA